MRWRRRHGVRTVTLALPAPYGAASQSGCHISLRAPHHCADEVARIAHEIGQCPEQFARRVADAIRGSGRYDCIVTRSVALTKVKEAMEACGGELLAEWWSSHHPGLVYQIDAASYVKPWSHNVGSAPLNSAGWRTPAEGVFTTDTLASVLPTLPSASI